MYAVLQTSLDQAIDRQTLEEALMATSELAGPDRMRLLRELFGIIVRGLSEDDALALQAALQARRITTEVVDESVLPVLAQPRRVRALNLLDTGISLVDLYDRETSYEWQHIVFAAGGGLLHLKDVQHQDLATVGGGRGGIKSLIVSKHRSENFPEFRLEVFLPRELPRVQWVLTKDSFITVNEAHLRLRDGDQLAIILSTLGNALSPGQVNVGIKRAMVGEQFTYPSVHAFEDEIVWSLYRMSHSAD